MKHIKYTDFQKAVDVLGLISKTSKSKIRESYLMLSKMYHPDMKNGDQEKFQKINDAYHLLMDYINNYRFELTQEEFKNQYPLSNGEDGDWLYGI